MSCHLPLHDVRSGYRGEAPDFVIERVDISNKFELPPLHADVLVRCHNLWDRVAVRKQANT